jgi:hypothetical protein
MTRVSKQAVARRLGHLTASIEGALAMIMQAGRGRDLLTKDDQDRIDLAHELLAGIEQRLWSR